MTTTEPEYPQPDPDATPGEADETAGEHGDSTDTDETDQDRDD